MLVDIVGKCIVHWHIYICIYIYVYTQFTWSIICANLVGKLKFLAPTGSWFRWIQYMDTPSSELSSGEMSSYFHVHCGALGLGPYSANPQSKSARIFDSKLLHQSCDSKECNSGHFSTTKTKRIHELTLRLWGKTWSLTSPRQNIQVGITLPAVQENHPLQCFPIMIMNNRFTIKAWCGTSPRSILMAIDMHVVYFVYAFQTNGHHYTFACVCVHQYDATTIHMVTIICPCNHILCIHYTYEHMHIT